MHYHCASSRPIYDFLHNLGFIERAAISNGAVGNRYLQWSNLQIRLPYGKVIGIAIPPWFILCLLFPGWAWHKAFKFTRQVNAGFLFPAE